MSKMIKYEPLILTLSHGFTAIHFYVLLVNRHIYLSFIMCCCCDDAAYSLILRVSEFFTTTRWLTSVLCVCVSVCRMEDGGEAAAAAADTQ